MDVKKKLQLIKEFYENIDEDTLKQRLITAGFEIVDKDADDSLEQISK